MARCRACGGDDLRPAGEVRGYSFVECPDCGFVVAPAVTQDWLEGMYAAAYHGAEQGAPAYGWPWALDFLAPALARLGPGRLRVFDFGAGQSTIADALRERAHRVIAADVAPPLRPHPDRLTGALRDLRLARGEFDLVYAFQVFEHLPEPRPILGELLRITRVGGLVLIHTDMETPERDARGLEGWWYALPPDHCAFYRHRTFDRLLERTPHRVVWRDPKSVLIQTGVAARSEGAAA